VSLIIVFLVDVWIQIITSRNNLKFVSICNFVSINLDFYVRLLLLLLLSVFMYQNLRSIIYTEYCSVCFLCVRHGLHIVILFKYGAVEPFC